MRVREGDVSMEAEAERDRERSGDAALLALKMESGASARDAGASRSWKCREQMLPEPPGGTQFRPYL